MIRICCLKKRCDRKDENQCNPVHIYSGNAFHYRGGACCGTHILRVGKTRYRPLKAGERTALSRDGDILKIMNLNIAHGRKDGPNQILQGKARIRSNLDDIAALLIRENPDIVGIQEADGPSIWSGDFDHVAYLSRTSGFLFSIRGAHVDGAGLSYGTAILSKIPMHAPLSVTFAPSPPTFSKGFVAAGIRRNNTPDVGILIASVHLDFSRRSIRKKQARTLADRLSRLKMPIILTGDFNCEWNRDDDSVLSGLADDLDLVAYRTGATYMDTFPETGKRLDWILIPRGASFISHVVIPDIVSDHRAVVATIACNARML